MFNSIKIFRHVKFTNLRWYLQKYNEGSLFGKWINLEEFSSFSELKNAMKELHNDEDDPEFMFQDYECPQLFEDLSLISECHIASNIYDVISTIEECPNKIEVLEGYYDCIGCGNDIDKVIENVNESYVGKYDSDVDFVQQLLEDCGTLPLTIPAYIHIDWNSTARDVMMDYSTSDNYYFRNL